MSGGETPWTKGPWSVCFYDCGDAPYLDHNGPCPSIQAPEDQDCAIVHWDGFKQEYWSSANGNQKQIEANARLIAAAPELAEVLETLLGGDPNGNFAFMMAGNPNASEAFLARARALLTRIEGSSHD